MIINVILLCTCIARWLALFDRQRKKFNPLNIYFVSINYESIFKCAMSVKKRNEKLGGIFIDKQIKFFTTHSHFDKIFNILKYAHCWYVIKYSNFLNKKLKYPFDLVNTSNLVIFISVYREKRSELAWLQHILSMRIKRVIIFGKSKDMCGYVVFPAIRTGLLHDIIPYITSPRGLK